jgi:hypothetical protein
MGKKDKARDIDAALQRAAETAKKGGRDARSGRFLVPSRLASTSRRSDQSPAKK